MRHSRLIVSFTLALSTLLAVSAEAKPRKPRPWHGKLVVYRRNDCYTCDRLETILHASRIKYEMVNLSERPSMSPTVHGNCFARHLSCRGYPLVETETTTLDTGKEMYNFLHDIGVGGLWSLWDEPLARESTGDGNNNGKRR